MPGRVKPVGRPGALATVDAAGWAAVVAAALALAPAAPVAAAEAAALAAARAALEGAVEAAVDDDGTKPVDPSWDWADDDEPLQPAAETTAATTKATAMNFPGLSCT